MRDNCTICGKDKNVTPLKDGVALICKTCFDNTTEKELKELIRIKKRGNISYR